MKIKKYNQESHYFFYALKNINWVVCLILLLLAIIGSVTLYSVSGGIFSYLVQSHIIKFICLLENIV